MIIRRGFDLLIEKNITESPFSKRRADSTHVCSIKTHDNNIVPKPDNVVRTHFENVNGLSMAKTGCHSNKVNALQQMWKKVNVELISLEKTQFNHLFYKTMFKIN